MPKIARFRSIGREVLTPRLLQACGMGSVQGSSIIEFLIVVASCAVLALAWVRLVPGTVATDARWLANVVVAERVRALVGHDVASGTTCLDRATSLRMPSRSSTVSKCWPE